MKLLVNTCTIGVPFVNEIEQAMAARGVTVVDYPISGKHAMHKGAAKEDLTAIVKYVERDAGFEIPKTR